MVDTWLAVDWRNVFVPDVSPLEIIVRGTIVYLVLVALLRVVPVRQIGGLGVGDLLVVVLIAQSVGGGLLGSADSVGNGILLAATLMFWNFALNWLDYRFPWFHRMYRYQPLILVKDGRPVTDNMRREFITKDELMATLRLHGIRDLSSVREACLEADGHISILTEGHPENGGPTAS